MQPAAANLNATTAISVERNAVWVVASLLHRLPSGVFGHRATVSCSAVDDVATLATARRGVTLPQIRSGRDGAASATTSTAPARLAVFAHTAVAGDGEPSELPAGKVDERGHLGMRTREQSCRSIRSTASTASTPMRWAREASSLPRPSVLRKAPKEFAGCESFFPPFRDRPFFQP